MHPYAESLRPEPPVNNAGGVTHLLDDWKRLDRFLLLGSDAPTYYVSAKKLTKENAEVVRRCIAADGVRVVRTLHAVSTEGRAPKNDAAILALAMCLKLGDAVTKAAAEAVVPHVCRTGTHLFQLAEFVQVFGGWGRRTKRVFANWYLGKLPKDLAWQVAKYQSRDGWSHRDILRLAKPAGAEAPTNDILYWATKGWKDIGPEPHPDPVLRFLWAFERAKTADVAETCRLIIDYGLPWECVRSETLREPAVWTALLGSLPMHAMIRNLGKMSSISFLTPLSAAEAAIVERLGDAEAIRKSRLHPFAILVAMRTYAQGHGEKGSLTWTPSQRVLDALDSAFYLAFQNVIPTGKRFLLALDVSGSMAMSEVANMPGITPRVASAAMVLVTMAVEPRTHVIGFTGGGRTAPFGGYRDTPGVSPLSISPKMRLDDVVQTVSGLDFGATDCALPMIYAKAQALDVDCFVILTDNETWAGNVPPMRALAEYRKARGIDAKLVVVGMTATEFTIADPTDSLCLDVVGLDTSTPAVISDFARA